MKFIKLPTSESRRDPLNQVLVNVDNVVAAYPQADGTTTLHMLDGDNIDITLDFDIVQAKLNMGARV